MRKCDEKSRPPTILKTAISMRASSRAGIILSTTERAIRFPPGWSILQQGSDQQNSTCTPVCHSRRVETNAKCMMKRGLQTTLNTVRCECNQRQNTVTEKTSQIRCKTPSQRGSLAPQHISRVAECRPGVGAEDLLPGFIYTVIRCRPWHM
jgi:hypothetical protein